MKRIFSLIIGIALIWTSGLSQVDTLSATGEETRAGSATDTLSKPDVENITEDDTLARALLWQISGDSISTSYLFGTIHLIPAEDYFLPEGTEAAFEQSDRIVFEIDMNEMTDIGAQMALLSKAMMKGGKRLRDLISTEDYEMVKAHFDDLGLPLVMLEQIKPMFLSVFASEDMSMDDLSSGSTKSYEMEFFELANTHEKDVGGLETMAFQISVFDSIPYEVQAEMLVESIRSQSEESSQFQDMIDTYKAQDIEALYRMLTSGEEDLGEYEDILVTDRNKNWIGVMSPMMKEGPVFFAVGAGHLGGDEGVIRLLEQEGYMVTPVLGKLDITSRPKKRF